MDDGKNSIPEFSSFEEWISVVPTEIKEDALWKVKVYQYALFLGDLCWYDVQKLIEKTNNYSLGDQLYRATGSISANIAEGYSKSSGRDQARFYEYALGSARESRDWYFKVRHIMDKEVYKHRNKFLTMIIKYLLKLIPKQRLSEIGEVNISYGTDVEIKSIENRLINHIPFS